MTGGTLALHLSMWTDRSAELAALRIDGIRAILSMPTTLLPEAVTDLEDLLQSSYEVARELPPAPPREQLPIAPVRSRRMLSIQPS